MVDKNELPVEDLCTTDTSLPNDIDITLEHMPSNYLRTALYMIDLVMIWAYVLFAIVLSILINVEYNIYIRNPF